MKRGLPKEPSTSGMILTAVSGISLGILLGSFILLKEAPLRGNKLSNPGKIGEYSSYYNPGSVASTDSATVRSRISRLGRQVPGSIPFTEMEINHYLSQYQSAETTEDGSPADISFSSPNVRLETDYFILSTKMVVSPTKNRFEVLVQAIGHIDNRGNGIELKIDKIILNSLVVPKFGGLVENLFRSNASVIPLPTEVNDALGAIREIELLQDQIVVTL